MHFPGSASAVVCVALLGLAAGARPARAADFKADAEAWYKDHTEAFEQAGKLAAEGYATDGNSILITLADNDGGPLAAYLIGNTLFKSDPAASARLHRRALESYPDEPAVILAVAMAQHRAGDYPAAIARYRQYLAGAPGSPYAALLADCLVRTGDFKSAVSAWDAARHDRNQPAIDLAICEIYGPLSPHQRRSDLIAKIEAGDPAKLNDLILLDLHFDSDWWTAKVFDDGLDSDLKRAAQLFGRKDGRYLHLSLYAKLARQEQKNPDEIRRALTSAQLVIGPDATLPANSQLAQALCELVTGQKIAAAADLWATHQYALRGRLASQDAAALHLLCWLAAATRNTELTEFDRLGWEEWNDPTFAASYLVDLFREKKLTNPNDSQLLAAMAVSKDDAKLNRLRIELAGDNVTTDMVAGAIKAEFRKLSVGEAVRDSSTLDRLFYELGKRL